MFLTRNKLHEINKTPMRNHFLRETTYLRFFKIDLFSRELHLKCNWETICRKTLEIKND